MHDASLVFCFWICCRYRFFLSVCIYPQHCICCKFLNYMIFTHREMNCIYEDYWIYAIKGALLLIIYILQNLIRNIGDEAFTALKAIDILYLFRYLSRCKTSCVHIDYLLIYFRDILLSLLHHLWLKRAVSILWHF